jgi:hypothetical protein
MSGVEVFKHFLMNNEFENDIWYLIGILDLLCIRKVKIMNNRRERERATYIYTIQSAYTIRKHLQSMEHQKVRIRKRGEG